MKQTIYFVPTMMILDPAAAYSFLFSSISVNGSTDDEKKNLYVT